MIDTISAREVATLSGTALERAVQGLSTRQVAARYDVTVQTVSRWCQRGLLPGARRARDGWHIPEAALAGFMQPSSGRIGARPSNAPRCVACTIILDEEWCSWDADGVCDVCQEALAVICRRTGLRREQALAQWMEREEVLV